MEALMPEIIVGLVSTAAVAGMIGVILFLNARYEREVRVHEGRKATRSDF